VKVEIRGDPQPTATLMISTAVPLQNRGMPYYDVYSPTFSPTLLMKVANEQQKKALEFLFK
jgi:hypothetical protein